MTGWICPRCNASNAPQIERCGCSPAPTVSPSVFVPQFTVAVCAHEYPTPWMGIVPPACLKCGEVASPYGFSCSTVVDAPGGPALDLASLEKHMWSDKAPSTTVSAVPENAVTGREA